MTEIRTLGSHVAFNFDGDVLPLYLWRKKTEDKKGEVVYPCRPVSVRFLFTETRALRRVEIQLAFDHSIYYCIEMDQVFHINARNKSLPLSIDSFQTGIPFLITLLPDDGLLQICRDLLAEQSPTEAVERFAADFASFRDGHPLWHCERFTFDQVVQQQADGTHVGFHHKEEAE